MHFLKEIVSLFDSYKRVKETTVGNKNSASNYELFFSGLKGEEFGTDADAKAFYIPWRE